MPLHVCHPVRAVFLTLLTAGLLLGVVANAGQPYSYEVALRSLAYSSATACSTQSLALWSCGAVCESIPGFQLATILNNDLLGTRGFVGVDRARQQIVVSYRGSCNIANWIVDMTFVHVPYDGRSTCGSFCRVHAGFFASYLSVQVQARSSVLALAQDNPTYNVLVTGHSLGGALAVLTAADLQEQLNRLNTATIPVVSLYTLGAPRVGNTDFARWVDALLSRGASYRLTHARDPVIKLPPTDWGYQHTTSEVFYRTEANSSMMLCNDSPGAEDPRCSLSVLSVVVADHLRYLGNTIACDSAVRSVSGQSSHLPFSVQARILWDYARTQR